MRCLYWEYWTILIVEYEVMGPAQWPPANGTDVKVADIILLGCIFLSEIK